MIREVAEAPGVVAKLVAANEAACRALAERLQANPPRFVVTCARGSSDSVATYAKYLIEIRARLVVASIGPSVSSVYDARPRMADALFLAISQSGRSPDLVTAAQTARDEGALTVAIVNDVTSPLAECCEMVLPLHAGPEKSVAATKSYLASLAACCQLVAHWTADSALMEAVRQLPDRLREALGQDWQAALPQLRERRGLYVVGRGPGYAAAQEMALKLKETCGLHAEAVSGAELMHGPLALAGPDFPVLVLTQDDEARAGLSKLCADLAKLDVPVIGAGPGPLGEALVLPADTILHPFVQPISLVQSFYPLAESLARARGHDPDRPPHLRKVTETR